MSSRLERMPNLRLFHVTRHLLTLRTVYTIWFSSLILLLFSGTPATAANPDPATLPRSAKTIIASSPTSETTHQTVLATLTSPDHQWVAHINQADEEHPITIESTNNTNKWHIAHPTPQNIGRTTFHLLQWEPKSSHIYIAERFKTTCAPFPMDINLYVADVNNQQLTPMLESIGTSLAISPDGTQLLYLAFNGRGIIIRNLKTGNETPISAPYEGPRLKPLGNFVWSPDGNEAVFAAVNDPCAPNMTFEIIWINMQTLRRRTLFVGDTYQMRPLEWRANNRVALRDKDGRIWLMNARNGQLTLAN